MEDIWERPVAFDYERLLLINHLISSSIRANYMHFKSTVLYLTFNRFGGGRGGSP